MMKLTVNDISIDRKEICFIDTKDGTDHWLKMHDELIPVLERRMEQLVDERLFPWDNPDKLLREFKRIARLAGIEPGRVWHTLRHTTATWMCERGVPLRSIMGVLNHSQMSTTLRYAKASDKAVAAAIDAM
jgi:integrase